MTIRTLRLPGPLSGRLLWPVMATLLVFGWSSGFIGVRFVNETADMALLLFWRTLLSGLILLPFALAFGPRIRGRAVVAQAGFGVLSVFIYLGGFALAIEQRVPIGLVALITDLLPLAIAALSQPMLGERLSRRQWCGTAIAVLGVLVVSADSLSLGRAPGWACALPLVAMLVFAWASVLHKGRPILHVPLHQALCIQSLAGAALFGLCAAWRGEMAPPLTAGFAFGMAWLVLIGTFLSYAVYYASLRLFPVARVSAAIYLSPPVTMLWAWALFGDPLSGAMFAGLAISLVGVWLTLRG